MTSPPPSSAARLLAGLIHGHARWILAIAVALTVGSIVLAVTRLRLVSDRTELMDPKSDFAQRWAEYRTWFHYRETLVVVVDGGAEAGKLDAAGALIRRRMRAFASRLAAGLRTHPKELPEVYERIDPASMKGLGLLYLPTPAVKALASRLTQSEPIIRSALTDGLGGIFEGLRDALDRATEQAGSATATEGAPAGDLAMLESVTDALQLAADGHAQEAVDVFSGAFDASSGDGVYRDPEGFIFFGGGRWLLIPAVPSVNSGQLNQISGPVRIARAEIAALRPEFPDLAVGVTGRSAVHSDEMATTNTDMTWATIGSVLGVLLMFRFFFRGLLYPISAVLALLMALAWTFGFATLAQGRLNLFAMVFAPILVGLGIDFGIYYLAHYLHALEEGRLTPEAITHALDRCGRGVVTGCVTTSAAFLSACFTEFRGLSELGLLCGVGLLLCMGAMVVVYPAMLVLLERWRRVKPIDREAELETAPPRAVPQHGWNLAVPLGITAVVAFIWGIDQDFNYNILSFQARGTESVEWEHVLIQQAHLSSYIVSIADNREEADRRREAFLARPDRVSRVETLYPADEAAKRSVLQELRTVLDRLPYKSPEAVGAADPAPPIDRACRRSLALLRQDFRAAAARDQRADRVLTKPIAVLTGLVSRWEGEGQAALVAGLEQFQAALLRFLRTKLTTLAEQCSPRELTPETLPDFFRQRFLGEGGRIAVFAYAAEDVWAWAPLNRFVAFARGIDARVTGTPVTVLESSRSLYRSFQASVVYALLVIAVILWLDFRRILDTALALVPLLVGLGLLIGFNRAIGLAFNFANYFSVPILIGCGVDCGVHMVHAWRSGHVAGTSRAILGCSLTTILGFGTMAFCRHRGVAGLGVMLVAGMTAITTVALCVLPAVLAQVRAQGNPGVPPHGRS